MENEIIKKCNPCQFYGFFIEVSDLFAPANIYPNPVETIDIEYQDLTDQKILSTL